MTIPVDHLQTTIGRNAVDHEGTKIGKVGQIYLDDETGKPVWATVHTGMFGTKESFAPLYGSTISDNNLVLAVSKDLVKGAPSVEADGHISDAENTALYQHYSSYLGADEVYDYDKRPNAGREDLAGKPGIVGRDTSGPTTDDAMTRSEERLRVGTEKVQTGTARLRKYIVAENVAQTVTLAHDEARLVREPITDANRGAAMAGGDLTEEEHEVILTAERPVVTKETVPVERVRLETETVVEQQEVSGTVRKEQIEQAEVDPNSKH